MVHRNLRRDFAWLFKRGKRHKNGKTSVPDRKPNQSRVCGGRKEQTVTCRTLRALGLILTSSVETPVCSLRQLTVSAVHTVEGVLLLERKGPFGNGTIGGVALLGEM